MTLIAFFSSHSHVVVHELKTDKMISIDKRNENLYKLKQEPSILDVKTYFVGNPKIKMILWHRRLEHKSFSALERIFSDLFKKYRRNELVW
jgi:GAG-pre-integrase domain